MLPRREREIFATLEKLKHREFVLIGGYAVNVYTLPRFSVDCDIVVKNLEEAQKIGAILNSFEYAESKEKPVFSHAEFARYVKALENGFRVSVDIMISSVTDRKMPAQFTAEWIFGHAKKQSLKGKTITAAINLMIIERDALIVMKCVSCRNTDIRDVFMLLPQAKDAAWIREETAKRCNFQECFARIKERVFSKKFRDELQGVYGYIDEKLFEKHQKAVRELGQSR